MKFVIEIWRNGVIVDKYKSTTVNGVLKWYNKNYRASCEYGLFIYKVYKNSIKLTYKELTEMLEKYFKEK